MVSSYTSRSSKRGRQGDGAEEDGGRTWTPHANHCADRAMENGHGDAEGARPGQDAGGGGPDPPGSRLGAWATMADLRAEFAARAQRAVADIRLAWDGERVADWWPVTSVPTWMCDGNPLQVDLRQVGGGWKTPPWRQAPVMKGEKGEGQLLLPENPT